MILLIQCRYNYNYCTLDVTSQAHYRGKQSLFLSLFCQSDTLADTYSEKAFAVRNNAVALIMSTDLIILAIAFARVHQNSGYSVMQ